MDRLSVGLALVRVLEISLYAAVLYRPHCAPCLSVFLSVCRVQTDKNWCERCQQNTAFSRLHKSSKELKSDAGL